MNDVTNEEQQHKVENDKSLEPPPPEPDPDPHVDHEITLNQSNNRPKVDKSLGIPNDTTKEWLCAIWTL